MSNQVRYYKGQDIRCPHYFGYVVDWDLSAVPEWKYKLKDNILYTVKEELHHYDSCGIMGDIEGEYHTVLYIEETPDKILDLIKKINILREEQRKYEKEL